MCALDLVDGSIVLEWKRDEGRRPTFLFTASLRCVCRMELGAVVLRYLAPSFSSAGRQDLRHLISM
jgi:hypothetical protein